MLRLLNVLLIVFLWFAVISRTAKADVTPPTGQPTCDYCGWCAPDPKPPTWNACNTCLGDATNPKSGVYYTVLGCFSTKAERFIPSFLTILFGVSGGLAFLAVLSGSVTVLTSNGDPIKLANGKETIVNALIGLFLIIFSVFLLRVIGLDLLQIPGFG